MLNAQQRILLASKFLDLRSLSEYTWTDQRLAAAATERLELTPELRPVGCAEDVTVTREFVSGLFGARIDAFYSAEAAARTYAVGLVLEEEPAELLILLGILPRFGDFKDWGYRK